MIVDRDHVQALILGEKGAGEAECATSNSRWLDDTGDGYKRFYGRDYAARRIALCWNACRHLTDDQLTAQVPA